MKWIGRRESGNISDRRGFPGGGGGMVVGGGIGVTLLYLLFNLVFGGEGVNFADAAQAPAEAGAPNGVSATGNASEDSLAHFASVVLADNEDVWGKIFSDRGQSYQAPTLVLFNRSTSSACGSANSATGPFYCPSDQ